MDMTATNTTPDPLLDDGDPIRFDAIDASRVVPAIETVLRRGRREDLGARAAVGRADLVVVRPAAAAGDRARGPSLVDRIASERGRRHAGIARRVQRVPAEGDGVLDAARAERGAVREVSGARAIAGVRVAVAGAPARRRDRAARLPARRRRAAAGRQGEARGDRGRAREAVAALLRERARRDERVRTRRAGRRGARRPAGRRDRRRAFARRAGRRRPATGSRCTRRRTLRSCSSRRIARCANASTRRM